MRRSELWDLMGENLLLNGYEKSTCCRRSSYPSDILVEKIIIELRETLIRIFSFMFDSLFEGLISNNTCFCKAEYVLICLCNPWNISFLSKKLLSLVFPSLYEDFELAKKESMTDNDVKTVSKMLLQAKDALVHGAYNLPVQIVARLGEKSDEKKKNEQKKNEKKKDSKTKKDDKGGKAKKGAGKKEEKKEEQEEEEKKDWIAALVKQAMEPHFACLVTKQRKRVFIVLWYQSYQVYY